MWLRVLTVLATASGYVGSSMTFGVGYLRPPRSLASSMDLESVEPATRMMT